MSRTDARATLAAEQAALLTALLQRGTVPAHVDPERARALRGSLRSKRLRTVQRVWPRTAAALGDRFASSFAQYALEHSTQPAHGPLADGMQFICWLGARDVLGDAVRLEALGVRLRTVFDRSGLCRVRRAAVGTVWLRQAQRLVIAIRIAFFGSRPREVWLRVPLGRQRVH